jgi:hypothetical protein
MMKIDGACHCGQVRFTAEIDASRVTVCHCSDCQVMSGAPFRAIAFAAVDSMVVHGQTKTYVKVAESGNRRAQVFCPECATPLWGGPAENATAVGIRLGCVTQRAALAPVQQIWQRSAMPWLDRLAAVPGRAT